MNIINEFFVSFILIKLYFKFKVCRKIKFPLLWKFYFSKWKFYFSADKNGGKLVKINNHLYYELSHKRKNLEEIPSSKRSMYKKRFAILEEIKQALDQSLFI